MSPSIDASAEADLPDGAPWAELGTPTTDVGFCFLTEVNPVLRVSGRATAKKIVSSTRRIKVKIAGTA